jgi:hypothetical protein
VLLAETGLPEWPDAQDEQAEGIGTSPRSYFHDVQVKKVHGHMVMLLSYWDAGWVLVNVDDPAHPQFIDDFTYPDPDTLSGVSPPEGNAHQAEFSHNNQFIIGTDEDFRPFRLIVKITSGPSADAEFLATQGGKAPIGPDTPLQGPTYFVGLACDPTALPPAPSDFAIALIERGRCSLTHTAVNVAAAGYEAAIVFNTSDPVAVSPCERIFSPRVETDIPFVVVPRSAGFALLGIAYDPEDCPGGTEPALPAIGTRGADVHVSAQFEGWGYVRLLDAQTLEQIAAYAITEALDWRFASNFGALTVHEVATDPKQNLAYLSYYAGGLRVVAFGKDGIQEVGHYIAEGGNNFWGVEVHRFPTELQGTDVLGREGEEQLILASDINSGLWIFRYTGK